MARIAFFTFGILHEPYGHERVQEFYDRIPAVFEAGEHTDGFVDRAGRGESWGEIISPKFYDIQKYPGAPPDRPAMRAPMTLSLWTDLESVYAFAYRGPHGDAFRMRKEWFVKAEWPTYVAWWVDDDHVPTLEEAVERHKHIHENGSTPHAFDFKTPFDDNGNKANLNRLKIEERRPSVG